MAPEPAAVSWRRSEPTVPTLHPTALAEEGDADTVFMTPNAELTGTTRNDDRPD